MDGHVSEFRPAARTAVQIAAGTAVLLALTLLAAAVAPSFGESRWEWLALAFAVLFLGALLAAALRVCRRAPVVLRIGPDGFQTPLWWRGPVRWSDIHRITRERSRHLFTRTDILRVDLSPGLLPPFRWPTFRRAELALQRHYGIRLPVHALDAPADEVVAAFARFRPVQDSSG